MASAAAIPPAAETPSAGAPAEGRWAQRLVLAAFLLPALVFLAVWLVYPTIRTIIRSFFDASGHKFIGFDNYKTLFTTDTLKTAIKNNALWLAVVPAFVTAVGLVFAVLTERIRWSVAFKTVVFMPMAISLFAAGVIWRIMDNQDPHMGALNAVERAFHDAFTESGVLQQGNPSTPKLTGSIKKGFVLATPLTPGGTALMGLTAIPPDQVPKGAKQAATPASSPGTISGTVWRDFT